MVIMKMRWKVSFYERQKKGIDRKKRTGRYCSKVTINPNWRQKIDSLKDYIGLESDIECFRFCIQHAYRKFILEK